MCTVAVAVLLMSGGLALTACVTPSTIEVTTTVDTVADDGVTSLREAFFQANRSAGDDTIKLAVGTTYDLTVCSGGPLVHTSSSSVTVTSDHATIHQTCTDTGIVRSTVDTSSLVIRGTILRGGPNSGTDVPGAGINVAGSLVLDDTRVTGVDAGKRGTVVEGNTGGAAEIDISLTNSIVTGNTGTGIRISNGAVRLHWSDVTGNSGTGIRISDGSVRLDSTYVNENDGDGVRLDGTSSLDADHAETNSNTGWGIYGLGIGDTRVALVRSLVDDNAAGGIYCSGCDVGAGHSSVSGNGADAAPGSGGGIVFMVNQQGPGEHGELSLGYSSVTDNRAQRSGGGIFVGLADTSDPDATTSTSLTPAVVEGNVTTGDGQHGGGIAVTVGNLHLSFAQIENNEAGGAGSDGGGIYLHETADSDVRPPPRFASSFNTIRGNRASGRGGGGYLDTTGEVHPGVDYFTGNTAGGQGGGAFVKAQFDPVAIVIFDGNTAGGQGGGLYLDGTGTIPLAIFEGNQATEGGGAFVGPTSDLSIAGGSFSANHASVQGGGIATGDGSRLDVTNSTLTGNDAPRGGGISLGAGPSDEPSSLSFVTLVGNRSPAGANVASSGGLVETFTALLVEPLDGTNCAVGPAVLTPQGYSFVSDTSCGAHPTDTISAAGPQLGPLTENGGFTPNRLPAATSPIVGTVPVEACTVDVDQRDVTRPQGAACEPGSVEVT